MISLPGIIEVAGRTLAVYVFIVLAIRLFGKKEISQLSVVDLVFILLISNSVQNAMVGPDSSLGGGLVAAGVLFIVNFILKEFMFKNKKFSGIVQGHAVMLVHQGKVLQHHLDEQKITYEELEAAIREHGVKSIKEVNLAVLEVDGNISILSDSYKKHSVRKRKSHKVLTQTS